MTPAIAHSTISGSESESAEASVYKSSLGELSQISSRKKDLPLKFSKKGGQTWRSLVTLLLTRMRWERQAPRVKSIRCLRKQWPDVRVWNVSDWNVPPDILAQDKMSPLPIFYPAIFGSYVLETEALRDYQTCCETSIWDASTWPWNCDTQFFNDKQPTTVSPLTRCSLILYTIYIMT